MELWLIGGAVAAVLLILLVWWISTANSFVAAGNKIKEAESDIEVALTKRYDMLTKLRDVAKNFMTHETDTFSKVIALRRGMGVEDLSIANEEMDAMSRKLIAVAENYPELRSSENFRQLQEGIRDAEEHLQAARRLYNANVNSFNTAIAVFPGRIVANAKGLVPAQLFRAEDSKKQDVDMTF